MDTCWFVLRQTHYRAPVYASPSMAFGRADGPLRLGHVLPGPRAVDAIVNTGGVLDFHRDMRVTRMTTANFRYARRAERTTEAGGEVAVPVAAAAVGATVGVDAGALFRRLIGDTWRIERLETQIVQPSLGYIEKVRESAEVAAWIARHKMLGAWKVYIVTGLMIARGAKNERTELVERDGHGGAALDLPGVATGKLHARDAAKDETDVSGEHEDDFVWAFRLSRISKGHFSQTVEVEPYTEGSVLAPGSEEVDVKAVLADEDLLADDVHSLEVLRVDSDEWDQPEQEFFVTMDGL